MRKATKTAAAWFGVSAGIAGLEHGFFEIQQGSIRPAGLMFPSIGPPCDPLVSWSACEPAMTLLPNLLVSGVLSFVLGLLIIVWSAFFLGRKHGGLALILFSIALLLVGGGIFPPLIGVVGGVTALKINRPFTRQPGRATRFFARLWPWPLVIWLVWVLGQFPFGFFFNDILKSIMGFGLLLIISMLPLSAYCAYCHDLVNQESRPAQ